ncbi:MAG: PDGLE domain-containing protein [Thermosynechococcaceae cyanobacterium]
MSDRSSQMRYGVFLLSGLGVAVAVAALLSPFASSNPDGLNRVAEDLKFTDKEHAEPPAKTLPFAKVFDGYALKGVPQQIAIPVAGIVGTFAAFGVAWTLGKVFVRRESSASATETEVPEHTLR